MFKVRQLGQRLGLTRSTETTEDRRASHAEKRAASRAEADELVHQLRQEAEAKRINERRAQSVREIEQSCRTYGWWFPQDRR